MRHALLAAAAIAASFLLAAPAGAYYQGPWCAGQSSGLDSWVENCSMPDFETCRREVTAGNRGVCFPNPYFIPAEPAPRRLVRRKPAR